MNIELEVIDAFVDGEQVDARALKTALASEDARDYFVDAWLLRDAVRNDAPVSAAAAATTRSASRSGRQWLVAAAISGSLLGGYALGNFNKPAAPVSPTATAVIDAAQPAAFPVPAPTRIIQLEFRNAPTQTGGN